MQALGCVSDQVAVGRHVTPEGGQCALQPSAAEIVENGAPRRAGPTPNKISFNVSRSRGLSEVGSHFVVDSQAGPNAPRSSACDNERGAQRDFDLLYKKKSTHH